MSEAEQIIYNPRPKEDQLGNKKPNRYLVFFLGATHIVIGGAAILMPVVASVAFSWLIGVLFTASGILQLVQAIQFIGPRNGLARFVGACLYLICGLILIFYTVPGLIALSIVLSFFYLATSATRGIQAIGTRGPERIWQSVSAILAFALGWLIIIGLPESAMWFLGLVIGVDLLMLGIAMIRSIK